jgi:macrolide transport system ATP-binding/permease protein
MNHLIELKGVSKTYVMGSSKVQAMKNLSITIDAGEFVAIMGQSGSGKSTLLNTLGFLDVPDQGSYTFMGREVSDLEEDELSVLRNNVAGFVFQQFQLLPRLSALNNVLLPTVYAGKKHMEAQAEEKLRWVGLGHRIGHSPMELSGGEQQRVAIARAMANDPVVVFADEPTGNLDTKSEEEIIALLKKMNEDGKTIIMVTHENEIAAHAKRIIRMKDGEIISDETKGRKQKKEHAADVNTSKMDSVFNKVTSFARAEFIDYVHQAFGSIVSHKLRSLLSMLGILIGVAAVISMLAIGAGAQESIEKSMSSLGSNLLTVMPGFPRQTSGANLQRGSVTRFTVQDAVAIQTVAGVKRVCPNVNSRVQAIAGDKNCNTQLLGAGINYEGIKSATPISGRFFNQNEVDTRSRVALVGATVVKSLFGSDDPVGKTMRINKVNFEIIGVLPVKGMTMMRDQDDLIVVPISTAMYRVLGKQFVDTIDVEVSDPKLIDSTMTLLKEFIPKRNKSFEKADSFDIMDMSEIRKTVSATTNTMSLLLGAVAAISLVVGGVGVMNIMLVSVKERTKEIGLRKAIGARRKDITVQFLVEAVLMTFAGGIAGIILGISVSFMITVLAGWAIKISALAVIGATLFSVIIGIGFGLWPAIQASRLNPIEALRSE